MAKGSHQLDGHFTRLARTFARGHGVEVIVRGSEQPRADLTNRRIYLPASADFATGEGREALEGLLDHEMAHMEQEALAEFEGRPGYADTLLQCVNGRERMWLNAFEDVRIEELWAGRWPGVRMNLEALARHGARVAGDRVRLGGTDPHWALGCGLIYRARGFGHLCTWLPADIEAILQQLEPEIADARHQQGPQDALALARRTLAKLAEVACDLPEVPPAAVEAAETLTDTDPECEDPLAEIAKTLKTEADAAAAADPCRVLPHPAAQAADRVIVPWEDPRAYRKAADRALPAVSALATRLAIWLRAKGDRMVADQLSGQIDGSALAALVTGSDRRIFQQTMPARDVRTAVAVLIDESGSMVEDHKYLRAREAAVGLGWTLQRCGIAFEILGWTDVEVEGLSLLNPGVYTRLEAQHVFAYKTFADHFPRVCKRLGTIEARENNDDASAILTIAKRLLLRPEPRKILLVLSDGVPCHAGYSPAVQLHHVIAQVRSAGIEIGGIGIGSDHVNEFYAPHVVVVHRPADLAVRVVELFKSLCQMTGARYARPNP